MCCKIFEMVLGIRHNTYNGIAPLMPTRLEILFLNFHLFKRLS